MNYIVERHVNPAGNVGFELKNQDTGERVLWFQIHFIIGEDKMPVELNFRDRIYYGRAFDSPFLKIDLEKIVKGNIQYWAEEFNLWDNMYIRMVNSYVSPNFYLPF